MHRDPGDENDFKTPKAKVGNLTFDVVQGHPNLSKQVNNNLLTSAINGGAYVKNLPANANGYLVRTRNTTYVLLRETDGWTIQGHPKYCPNPVRCNIHGSTWGGSMIKIDFIGRGMHLEVGLIVDGKANVLTTSPIEEVDEI